MRKNLKVSFALALLFFFTVAARCTSGNSQASLIGDKAMEYTASIIGFGPRPPASQGIKNVQDWLKQRAKEMSFVMKEDSFTANTPKGTMEMLNLSYVIPGKAHDKKVVLLAHYDSKLISDFTFIGANDAASSVALLLALSNSIQKLNLAFDVEVVFVDGEEAIVQWSSTDSLYGSRHYAASVNPSQIKAAINVDMVGDKDLKLIRSSFSDANLVSAMEKTLKEVGKLDLLDTQVSSVEDDHVPFANIGVPVLHLMDFTFGGSQTPGIYWHTADDTLDKISATSLATVAQVILGVLPTL